MPHPTPTAATSASPPPRGKGLGVEGRPAKPRPGPEPGPLPAPRPTREVPGQARDGVALTLLTLLLTTPATAQIIPTGSPAADILLSQAIAEHRTFLTCSALDPALHVAIRTAWQQDTAAAAATLAANQVPPEAITAFSAAAAPENLLPAPDTPFDSVRQLCGDNPDWLARYQQTPIRLATALPKAFP